MKFQNLTIRNLWPDAWLDFWARIAPSQRCRCRLPRVMALLDNWAIGPNSDHRCEVQASTVAKLNPSWIPCPWSAEFCTQAPCLPKLQFIINWNQLQGLFPVFQKLQTKTSSNSFIWLKNYLLTIGKWYDDWWLDDPLVVSASAFRTFSSSPSLARTLRC